MNSFNAGSTSLTNSFISHEIRFIATARVAETQQKVALKYLERAGRLSN